MYSEKCRAWYKMGQEEVRVVGLSLGESRALLNLDECALIRDIRVLRAVGFALSAVKAIMHPR